MPLRCPKPDGDSMRSVRLVTSGAGEKPPQMQCVLAYPQTACMTSMNTGEVVELFDGGWLPRDEGLSAARMIVARHRAPAPGKPVSVGKRIAEWVYELFITTRGGCRIPGPRTVANRMSMGVERGTSHVDTQCRQA